jgi:hypothetical protein
MDRRHPEGVVRFCFEPSVADAGALAGGRLGDGSGEDEDEEERLGWVGVL